MNSSNQDLVVFEQLIFIACVVTLGSCALGIIYIDSTTKAKHKSLSYSRLQFMLWKFSSATNDSQMLDIDRWSWRKLVLAGAMIAATFTTVSSKRIGVHMALSVSGVIMIAWLIFIVAFWRLGVLPKYLPRSDEKIADSNSKIEKNTEENTTTEIAAEISTDSSLWQLKKRFGSSDTRLPVTIITGFLGSGKTTLVKNILNNTIGMKVLVIENEIGSEGIDHELLMQQVGREEVILLNNGCICCTVRQDLLTTFKAMIAAESFAKLDWVVIETTGLADPAPVIQTLYMDDECKARLRLDSVLAVVDSKHLPAHLTSYASADLGKSTSAHDGIPEAVQQLLYADRILLNKIDLVTTEALESLMISVTELNSLAKLLTCQYSSIPLEDLLNIKAFDPLKCKALLQDEVRNSMFSFVPRDAQGNVLKKKVSLNMKTASPALLNRVNVTSDTSAVMTLSLVTEEPLSMDKFNAWIASLLQTRGPQIYRMKGILNMAGFEETFVVHGIHMIFDGEKGAAWPSSASGSDPVQRVSKLVFIGLGLERDELEAGFLACRASDSSS